MEEGEGEKGRREEKREYEERSFKKATPHISQVPFASPPHTPVEEHIMEAPLGTKINKARLVLGPGSEIFLND